MQKIRASFLILAVALGVPAHAAGAICPSILQPVCAQKDGAAKTFPNRCLAEGAGFAIVGNGGCDGATRLVQTFCTKEYVPVCAEKDGVRNTFGNACEARAEGFAVVAQGAC